MLMREMQKWKCQAMLNNDYPSKDPLNSDIFIFVSRHS